MDKRRIGIFDSGVGGLTVVSEVMKAMPGESVIYFGDTARVPYGTKSRETVTEYGRQIIGHLLKQDVKAIIIACNTISSNSYDVLAGEFDIPLIELVTSGVQAVLDSQAGKKIGVIATETTINSGLYEKRLLAADPGLKIYSKACPLFVPLAEEGWTDNEDIYQAAKTYLADMCSEGIGGLLLACTHYPLLIDGIKRVTGDIKFINPAEKTASRMKKLLEERDMSCPPDNIPAHKFCVSSNPEKFAGICAAVLGREYPVDLVVL